MPREEIRSRIVLCAVSGVFCGAAAAQPSSWVCGTTSGGKTICVRYDNRSTPPQLDDDFTRNLNDPPSVTLKRGQDNSGVIQWRIKCYDTNGPADVGNISVDGSEDFEVLIADENGGPGAANMGSCSLAPTGDNHAALRAGSIISGNLTNRLSVKSDSAGNGGELNLVVEGDVASSVNIAAHHAPAFTVGAGFPPDGTFAGELYLLDGLQQFDIVRIGFLTGLIDLKGSDLRGTLSIYDGGPGTVIGGTIVEESGGFNSSINLNSDFSGTARFAGVTPGIALIQGQGVSGLIHFTGDFDGDMEIVHLTGEGRVRIDGTLRSTHQIWPTFIRFGTMSADAALTVDFDGWHESDDWVAPAVVEVGDLTFEGNHPEDPDIHIWEVTECKGDMNNNGTVNTFDINGFVAALSSVEDYEELYPGLEGSMVYHGDMDCNGTFNTFDIQPFLDRVEDGCCSCGGCGLFMGGGGMSAEEAAGLFLEYSDASFIGNLVERIADLIESLSGAAAEYWSEVRDFLEKGEKFGSRMSAYSVIAASETTPCAIGT